MLLGVVEVLDRDSPEVALENFQAALGIARDGKHAALDSDSAATAAADGANDDRAAAVDVAVEQAVQSDDRLVVGGRRVDEVDDQAGLLARGAPRHPPDPLLIDPARSGRREVHADRRSRRVPALGEEHRVAENVDLSALEGGEGLGQLALGRLARYGTGVDADVAHRRGYVFGVGDSRGVEDPGDLAEAGLVEVGDRHVEGSLVEQLGQFLLVEVLVDLTAAQRNLRQRTDARTRGNADAPKWRDHPAPSGLGEVEA